MIFYIFRVCAWIKECGSEIFFQNEFCRHLGSFIDTPEKDFCFFHIVKGEWCRKQCLGAADRIHCSSEHVRFRLDRIIAFAVECSTQRTMKSPAHLSCTGSVIDDSHLCSLVFWH